LSDIRQSTEWSCLIFFTGEKMMCPIFMFHRIVFIILFQPIIKNFLNSSDMI